MYHPPRFHENIQLGPYRYELYFNGHSVNLAYRNSSIGTQRRADGVGEMKTTWFIMILSLIPMLLR